jgi:hypothetical protein
MHDSLTVDMCVGIRKGCPLSYLITADGQVEFSFGGARDGFYYAFDASSLRDFLVVGAEALAELDAQAASTEAGQAAPTAPMSKQPA